MRILEQRATVSTGVKGGLKGLVFSLRSTVCKTEIIIRYAPPSSRYTNSADIVDELTTKIRATPTLQDIPVVLVTSRDADGDRTRGFDVGADEHQSDRSAEHTHRRRQNPRRAQVAAIIFAGVHRF